MIFEYPLGLLGLIGIPILILIYIIKSHYTEQTISSTYIWELSERFLKKKRPVSKLSGIISLILQMLIVLVASVSLAKPVFIIPNSANEFCFILDGSASMNITSEDTTRFEKAKDEIEKIIVDSIEGSKYSLILVCENSRVIYDKLQVKADAISLLNDLQPSHLSTSCVDSIEYAQEYFNNNTSTKVYLISDKEYQTNNITLVNVSNAEENYAILDTNCVIQNSTITVNSNIISYESNCDVNIDFIIDGNIIDTKIVSLSKLQATPVVFFTPEIEYESIELKISDIDNFNLDNSYVTYNVEKEHSYTTLLVSENGFYLESLLNAYGVSQIQVIKPKDYVENISGYGLYIFDSYSPTTLPTDGTIWLFNSSSSIAKSGFSVQDEVTIGEDEIGELVYSKNKTSLFKSVTKNITGDKFYVYKYIKYSLYSNFSTILSYNGYPLVFVGDNQNGNRQVVFGFDLQYSNLPMLGDYLIMLKNLIDYSFPTILDEGNYYCGDNLTINVISGCDSIRVESPNGNISYMDVSSTISEYKLTEVGTYKIKVIIGDVEKNFNVYSQLSDKEFDTEIEQIILIGDQTNDLSDGVYTKLIIFFIILAVIYMADWMVYCYEQYQLR